MVNVDLRPNEIKVVEGKKIDLSRVIALTLIVVFVVVSCFVIIYDFFIMKRLATERQILEADTKKLILENKKLDSYLAEVDAQLDLYQNALTLLKEDILSIEFLTALVAALPDNVWLTGLKVVSGRADVNGYAFAENDIAAFALKLLNVNVVRSISPLVTSKGEERNLEVQGHTTVKFNFSCILEDLVSIQDPVKGAEGDEDKH